MQTECMEKEGVPVVCEESDQGQRLIAMGQMAASLAHEIRNPLGSMELFCTLLKKDLMEQPDALNLAEQIHSGIRRLNHIITNCLQFSRDLNPSRSAIKDLQGFLEESVKFVEPRVEAIGAKLSIEHHGSGSVSVDKHQIAQALLNVLLNALEAVEEKGSDGEISIVSDLRDADLWVLSVSDNGPGIAEEHLQQIFDPFFSTKEEGTGLGLPIVFSIIGAHHGTFTVSNNKQAGTTARFAIPRSASNE